MPIIDMSIRSLYVKKYIFWLITQFFYYDINNILYIYSSLKLYLEMEMLITVVRIIVHNVSLTAF